MGTTGITRIDGAADWTAVDWLALLALVAPWLAAALLPAVAQWQSYHDFADARPWLGLPHAFNVLSNLPFLVIGALGLWHLARAGVDRRIALPYGLFFVGVLLTSFGSAWYHLDPRDATLVWDRLPIALGFAGLVAATLVDRVPRRSALFSAAFASVAVASVLNWFWGGNLVPYLAMQASFAGVALVATARVPSRFTRAHWLYGATALYGAAIACEKYDRAIEAWTSGGVSGHTLKHLLAALGLYVVYAMLRRRRRAGAQ
jgi:hypothetical protein